MPARAGISVAPVPVESPHMGKGTPLTSTMVGRAVYELLEYESCVWRYRTCIDLTSQKSFIRQVAEHTFATLTFGLDLMQMPLEQVTKLRDPYVGKWEPFCSTVATGAPSVAVSCMTRGSMLFTELHDLGGDFVVPSTFIRARTDKLPEANAWHDSLSGNTCCHFQLSPESVGQYAHERRRALLDYNSCNKVWTEPSYKTIGGCDGIAAGIAATANDVNQGATRMKIAGSVIDRSWQLAESCIGPRGFSGHNACSGGQSSSLGSCLVERLLLDHGKKCRLRYCLQNDFTGTCVQLLFEHADEATGLGNELQHDNSGLGYPLLERLLLDDTPEGSVDGRGACVSQAVSS